ncbi:hypothetical protein BH10ACT1_BH10ACT1_07160 [soil metagenome]
MSALPVLHHPQRLEERATIQARRFDAEAPAGSRRRLVLLMAAFTTAVEVASIAGAVPDIPFGSLDLPLSIIPALGLAVACGERLLGRSTARRAAIGYWVVIAMVLPVLAVLYVRQGRLPLWTSLIVASVSEELVYRLAIPAVIATLLRIGRVRADWARMASLAFAGLWFVLLPGHREQMHSVASAVPFVAFAALSALIVYRSGSVLPMAAGHAVINLLTVLVWSEAVAADARGMGLACVLGLLVLAYGRPKRITISDDGGLVDTRTGLIVTGIDLRDGHPTSVTLADGTRLRVTGALPHDTVVPERTVG